MIALLLAAVIQPPTGTVYLYVEDGVHIRKLCLDKGTWYEMAVESDAPDWKAWKRKIKPKEVCRLIGPTLQWHFNNTFYRDVRTYNGTNETIRPIGRPATIHGMVWPYGQRKGPFERRIRDRIVVGK